MAYVAGRGVRAEAERTVEDLEKVQPGERAQELRSLLRSLFFVGLQCGAQVLACLALAAAKLGNDTKLALGHWGTADAQHLAEVLLERRARGRAKSIRRRGCGHVKGARQGSSEGCRRRGTIASPKFRKNQETFHARSVLFKNVRRHV